MTSKCETARHHEMPRDCRYDKHEKCELCGGCYTCLREQMPVTVVVTARDFVRLSETSD